MEQYSKNEIVDWQTGINKAFGRMYFAIYSIDLVCGRYLEISTLDIFREHIPPQEHYQLLFDMVVMYYVSDGYKDGMRAFLNMDTLQERLSEQNAVSNEFFGTTQGWCRASLVVEKRNDEGKVLRLAYVTQEINEEVKTEQERIAELKRAYAAVDTANQAKSDFLFRMSHDIRTPLNAIMGFEQLIMSRAEDIHLVREYAEKIRVSGNLLLSLLNEILDMTKLESGKIDLKLQPFGLDELLHELEVVVRSQTEDKQQTFIMEKRAPIHEGYVGDRARISRVLFNILGNAVRYTPEHGEIRFTIREESTGIVGHSILVFCVKDNGIGMAPELKNKIFDEFTRGTESAVSQEPGAGLGLSIARSFTAMMGGSIKVESEPDKGSEFVVRLPLLVEEIAWANVSGASQSEEDILNGLHVLIVEDNDMNMEIIVEILKLAGVVCDTAYSGLEAIRKMEQAKVGAYDLIIMDIRMPLMDGYETTRRIRAMDRADASSMPIIALTANAFEEDVENAKRAGMNAHMAKPLNMKQFRRVVKELL